MPKGTKVQVTNDINFNWYRAYFIGYISGLQRPYIISFMDDFIREDCPNSDEEYKYIRLYDESDLKEEWLED